MLGTIQECLDSAAEIWVLELEFLHHLVCRLVRYNEVGDLRPKTFIDFGCLISLALRLRREEGVEATKSLNRVFSELLPA